jgi:CBS domain-containing protein
VPPIIELTGQLLDRSIEEIDKPEDHSFFTYRDRTIKEVLENKTRNREPEMIFEGKSVFEAISDMTTKKLGALIVHDADGKVSGIITERDYMNKIAVQGRNSRDTKIKDVMSRPVLTVPTYARTGPVLKLMTDKRFRHCPVVDDSGNVIGMISIGDLVKEITDEYRETIKNLNEYIERTY